ncbi:MAG: radical SAM protein [Candidatus Heteroscillospira sp.]|jgi:putative pyruvate formate lyase activating enzyme
MSCRACPRACGADRAAGQSGFCRVPEGYVISRAAPHFWEEPCISGLDGSGAIFFTGCNLGCVFCQNHDISRGGKGKAFTEDELIYEMRRLQDEEGVHNINLVTPSHYAFQLAKTLEKAGLSIPVVWNSSGYDSLDALRALDGLVQIWLPDLKYLSPALASRYSHAPDYPDTAVAAILEMYRQSGSPVLDENGIMRSGVVVRHLIMPGQIENTLDVIDWVDGTFPDGGVLFSLMAQYTPMPGMPYPELQRPVTREEYDRVISYLELSGIENGFVQDLSAAGEEYIPEFY